MGLGLPSVRYKATREGLCKKRSAEQGPQLANQAMKTPLNKTTTTVILRQFSVAMKGARTKEEVIKTRRLAAYTQAVDMLRSTSYIAIELECSAFKVVRNSIESMYSSYSAFDCISWNRAIGYYPFTELYHVK